MRNNAGMNWIPQAVRKEAAPLMKEHPYPVKNMIKIPQFKSKLSNNDNITSLVVLSDLGKVDRHLRGSNTNTHAVWNASGNELAEVLAGNLDSGSN